jgi:hypothetical protein
MRVADATGSRTAVLEPSHHEASRSDPNYALSLIQPHLLTAPTLIHSHLQCDEAHPSCRNCAKSKRDCLGYDPIFKPQPGPPQIQPAPNASAHQTSSPVPAPPISAPYSAQVPQGYAPAATAGYPPPPSASVPAHPQHDNFNSSAIDPALAAADPVMHGQPPYNGVHALRGSPYSSTASDAPPLKGGLLQVSSTCPTQLLTPKAGKPLNISDIFSIAHHNPPEVPPRPTSIPPELDEEFAAIFAKDYIQGLDIMLETKWFSTDSNALNRLFANRALHEEAIFFTETVKYRTSASDMSGVFSQEARLIWHMLESCKHPDPVMNGTNGTAHTDDDLALKEVRLRFDILEALLTNQNLDSNPLRSIAYPMNLPDQKRAELDFWEQLGEFVVHADSDSAPPGAADYALGRMRNVLMAHEVRDAIYSIAIARHAGNRVRGFPNALPTVVDQNPESDLTKLNVAMSFISHECRSGTQQVIARLCDMAMLSWTVSRAS